MSLTSGAGWCGMKRFAVHLLPLRLENVNPTAAFRNCGSSAFDFLGTQQDQQPAEENASPPQTTEPGTREEGPYSHGSSTPGRRIRSLNFLEQVEELMTTLRKLWSEDQGQDIAEYAVMLAVILVLVVGTVRLIGSNANNAFSSVASSLQ